MKVYSWKTLLLSILIGGGCLIHYSIRLYRGDWSAAPWTVLFSVLTVRGLWVSLTEKGYKKDMENAERGKRIYRARFGKLAPIMPYGALIFTAAAWFFAWAFPVWEFSWTLGICVCMLIAGFVYQVWLTGVINEEIAKEKEAEKERPAG